MVRLICQWPRISASMISLVERGRIKSWPHYVERLTSAIGAPASLMGSRLLWLAGPGRWPSKGIPAGTEGYTVVSSVTAALAVGRCDQALFGPIIERLPPRVLSSEVLGALWRCAHASAQVPQSDADRRHPGGVQRGYHGDRRVGLWPCRRPDRPDRVLGQLQQPGLRFLPAGRARRHLALDRDRWRRWRHERRCRHRRLKLRPRPRRWRRSLLDPRRVRVVVVGNSGRRGRHVRHLFRRRRLLQRRPPR